jgi:copper resistance protein C
VRRHTVLDDQFPGSIDEPQPRKELNMRKAILAYIVPTMLLSAASASAHAHLEQASPAVSGTVTEPPATITLRFSEKLEAAFSSIEVQDDTGRRVDKGKVSLDPNDAKVLRIDLKVLSPGLYKVIWRAISVDTHTTTGDFTFHVTGK